MRHVCLEELEYQRAPSQLLGAVKSDEVPRAPSLRFSCLSPLFDWFVDSALSPQMSRLLPARAGASCSRSHTSLFTADGTRRGRGCLRHVWSLLCLTHRIAAEDIGGPLLRGAYARAVLLSRESRYGSAGRSSGERISEGGRLAAITIISLSSCAMRMGVGCVVRKVT
ncbi:hypothetical protein B0H14DRAFT_3604012 [Mycena olivaceomarginata]|nr:hypothetical protein B0H14DRAFT_3604012 [Mycena olivaceomarginata]